MMKLSKIAEALAEGWHAFRVTLSAQPRNPVSHYNSAEPKEIRHQKGDMWVKNPEQVVYFWTGRKWKEIKVKRRFPKC